MRLRDCPFCGSADIDGHDRFGGPLPFAVVCNGCMCIGPEKATRDEAWAAWNGARRPGDS